MNLRSIATPLTIGSSLLLSVTGLALLLRFRGGLMDPLHEISSIVFLVALLLHLWIHRNAVAAHLKRPSGLAALGIAAALSALAILSLFHEEDGSDPRWVARRSMELLLDARPSDLARLTSSTDSALISRISEGGNLRIAPGATLREIARTNHRDPMGMLGNALR